MPDNLDFIARRPSGAGKRARLIRYWGEGHGLRLSPANTRNIVEEIFAWLELNMPEKS